MTVQLKKIEGADLGIARFSCKDCHGTGIYGTLVEKNGLRKSLVCRCVLENMQRFNKKVDELKKQGAAYDPLKMRADMRRGRV